MTQMTQNGLMNWLALYAATGLCCCTALVLSVVMTLGEFHRARTGNREDTDGCAATYPAGVVAVATSVFVIDTGNAAYGGVICRNPFLELSLDLSHVSAGQMPRQNAAKTTRLQIIRGKADHRSYRRQFRMSGNLGGSVFVAKETHGHDNELTYFACAA